MKTMLILILTFNYVIIPTSCSRISQASNENIVSTTKDFCYGTKVSEINTTIRSIFNDSKGNYWFGSDGVGVFKYDGKSISLFSEKDGLINNQVKTIQEDKFGNIYFGTGNGISRYNGKNFHTLTIHPKTTGAEIDSNTKPDYLWFDAPGGLYYYDGNFLNLVSFPKTKTDSHYYSTNSNNPDPFGVYYVFKDSKNRIWFGTESQGIGYYNGRTFTWFTDLGLDGAAARAIYEDNKGLIWLSNNGLGIFHYNGNKLMNFTEKMGLSNDNYVKAIKYKSGIISKQSSKEGTLSSIMHITGDDKKNVWIATYDSGIWHYDGQNIINYTKKDGLSTNSIMNIYNDKHGSLWIGTGEDGVFKFNGKRFEKFYLK